MTYKCINCGREMAGFNCTCKRDNTIWDSSLRKSRNKSKNKEN